MLLTRKRVILAGIEAVYGTDPVLTGAANAILVKQLNIVPSETVLAKRDLVRPFIGASDQLPDSIHVAVDFEVEIAGSSALGVAPAYGILLRACALAQTISAGVSVAYAPISSGMESCTIYYNVDGTQHKVTGCRGTVELDFTTSQIPVFKFKMTGIYNAPADVVAPVPTYTGFKRPLVVNNTNTTVFSLHGYAAPMMSVSLNVANTALFRSLVGEQNVMITDRESTGKFEIEAPTITAHDYFTEAANATLGAVSLTHGPAGNQVAIAAPNTQIIKPTYADKNGVQMLSGEILYLPTTGNDEFSITIQ